MFAKMGVRTKPRSRVWHSRPNWVHTADEKSVTSEHSLILAIIHEVADAVLSVAGCMHRLNADFANVEVLLMFGCCGHTFTILAADDSNGRVSQLCQLSHISVELFGGLC